MIAKQVITQDNKFVLLISEHRVDAFEFGHSLLGQMIIAPTSNKGEFNIREELLFHPNMASNDRLPRYLGFTVSPIYPEQLLEDQGMVVCTHAPRFVSGEGTHTKTACIYQTGSYSPSYAMTHSTVQWFLESLLNHRLTAQGGAGNIPSWLHLALDLERPAQSFSSLGVPRDYEEAVRVNAGGLFSCPPSSVADLLKLPLSGTDDSTPPWKLSAEHQVRRNHISQVLSRPDSVPRNFIPISLGVKDGVVQVGYNTYISVDALKTLPERFADWVVQEPPADTGMRHNWFSIGQVYHRTVTRYGLRDRIMPIDVMMKTRLTDTLLTMTEAALLNATSDYSYEFAAPAEVEEWHDELMAKYSIWDLKSIQRAPLGPLTLGICLLGKIDQPDAERFSPETIFTIGRLLASIAGAGCTKQVQYQAETHEHDLHYVPGGRFALISHDLIAKVSNAVIPVLDQAGVDLPTFLLQQADKHRASQVDPAQQRDEMGILEKAFNEVVVAQLSIKLDAPQLDSIKASAMVVYDLLGLEAATKHMWHMVHVFRSDMYNVDNT